MTLYQQETALWRGFNLVELFSPMWSRKFNKETFPTPNKTSSTFQTTNHNRTNETMDIIEDNIIDPVNKFYSSSKTLIDKCKKPNAKGMCPFFFSQDQRWSVQSHFFHLYYEIIGDSQSFFLLRFLCWCRILKNCFCHNGWFPDHVLHWLLCETGAHSNQQYHCWWQLRHLLLVTCVVWNTVV